MFVVGIDPGLTRCGFGAVRSELDRPEAFRAEVAGVLETPATDAVELRLAALHHDVVELFSELQPDVVVVERVFFQKNAKTAIGVAQAAGVAIAVAGTRGIPVVQYTAQEVKMAVTGYGAASKKQVQSMVAQLCGLEVVPEPADAADALGLALTHLMNLRTLQRIPAALR
jgi:crossover junction endodeoxyribonuclease RuvC